MKTQSIKVDSRKHQSSGVKTSAVDALRQKYVAAKGVVPLRRLLSSKYEGPEISGKN